VCADCAFISAHPSTRAWKHKSQTAMLLEPQTLAAARHIYEQAGFRMTSSEKRRSFGKNVIAEYWDLKL
jgi:hypothetical protein